MYVHIYIYMSDCAVYAVCHHVLYAHAPTAHPAAISRYSLSFRSNFFPKWPPQTKFSTVPVVIWPTPGTLVEK